jgi:hypothetical protein
MRSAVCAFLLIIMTSHAQAALTITRERCEELYAKLSTDDPWPKSRCGSSLAWGESGVIQAILDFYEVTGDPKYLRDVVRRGDRMLSHRDDKRGFKDSTGKAHKAWSMARKYTVAEGVLLGSSGKAVIRVRSVPYAYNDQTKVVVTASAGGFSLRVTNDYYKRDETFADLSLDPKSARYFERIVNDTTPTPNPDGADASGTSQLVKLIPLEKMGLPNSQSVTLEPLWLAYCGYIGIIYHPLLRFADMVKSDPKLKKFEPAADRFIQAADESYDEFRTHFRNGPGRDEGYYITCERGGAFPYDNLPEPFNYLGEHTASELLLYKLTGKPIYKDQAERMAGLFKHRLKLMPGNLYVWNYWYEPLTTGYSREADISDNYPSMLPKPVVEDASHGTLDIRLVVSAAHAGIVFNKTDLRRFANTFLKNVVLSDKSGFNGRVDGTAKETKYGRTGISGWLPLAEVNPKVYEACREVYINRNQEGFGSLARLLLWEKRLARPALPQ